MCVHSGTSCRHIFIIGQKLFQLCIFIAPILIVGIECLRYCSPACVARKYSLFDRCGSSVFGFDIVQSTDCFNISGKSRLWSFHTEIFIGNYKISRIGSVMFHRNIYGFNLCFAFKMFHRNIGSSFPFRFFNNSKFTCKKIRYTHSGGVAQKIFRFGKRDDTAAYI